MNGKRKGALWFLLAFFIAGISCAGESGDDEAPDGGASDADGGEGEWVHPRERLDLDELFANVTPCVPDESAPPAQRDSYGQWIKVELPDTMCSNGSQYKFWVNYSNTSNNLAIMFEGGGACWDYSSCTGEMGIRGAANPNGLDDNHGDSLALMYPIWTDLGLGERDGVPYNMMATWNRVVIPYCTGDVYAGNIVQQYTSSDGSDTITYRHVAQPNMQKMVAWLDEQFPEVPRLFVGGCSAGGTGALVNYHLIRKEMQGVQCGYLMDDSGPIFPTYPNDSYSRPLHQKIREAWNTDATIDLYADELEAIYGKETIDYIREVDLGVISEFLAAQYPRDRLSLTVFRWDFNYSLYSYESFYNEPPNQEIFEMWGSDLEDMMAQYDLYPNLAYYIPFARPDICSHCLSVPPTDHLGQYLGGSPYYGTEIEEQGVDLFDFYLHLLDDATPLRSYREQNPPEGEGLTKEQADSCRGVMYMPI